MGLGCAMAATATLKTCPSQTGPVPYVGMPRNTGLNCENVSDGPQDMT